MMFRLRMWWLNNRNRVLFALVYTAAMIVGVVGIYLLLTRKERPLVPVQVVISVCDFSPRQLVSREELDRCIRRVTYLADPLTLAGAGGLDAGSFQPVFRSIPEHGQYRVVSGIQKGMALNGSEFEPYIPSRRFVLLRVDPAYASSEVVVFHIRKQEILGSLMGMGQETGASPAGEGGASIVGTTSGFQLRIEGRCEGIISDQCVFVVSKSEILDVDGRVIRSVAEETALAVLQEVSGSHLSIPGIQPLTPTTPGETGAMPGGMPGGAFPTPPVPTPASGP